MAYRCINKLSRHIHAQKDHLKNENKNNAIYKIECTECDVSYVGQTKRMVKTRMKEHRNQINRNVENQSVITIHRNSTGHEFDWQNIKILDLEKSYSKRCVSEMIHIKLQKNPINVMSDTDRLKPYFTLLESFKD